MKLFAAIAKGLIRDQTARRHTMFFVVLAALIMLFLGATFLNRVLLDRPVIFLIYWGICAWLTFLSILLALYDLLVVRLRARELRRKLIATALKKDL